MKIPQSQPLFVHVNKSRAPKKWKVNFDGNPLDEAASCAIVIVAVSNTDR